MYSTEIIRNLFKSSKAFIHKWLKWRSYSPFAFMLFCNLTPLDGRFVNAIVFCQKSEFCEYITSLHIQRSIYVRQFEFTFLLWNKLHLYFVTFLLLASIVKRVYGAWELECLPLLSFSIHNEQRQVNIAVFFNIWLKTVNNWCKYCIYNRNNPPIMFFVSNITFSGVRIFTRNIYFNCTDISDTRVQMFLRTNDKNN